MFRLSKTQKSHLGAASVRPFGGLDVFVFAVLERSLFGIAWSQQFLGLVPSPNQQAKKGKFFGLAPPPARGRGEGVLFFLIIKSFKGLKIRQGWILPIARKGKFFGPAPPPAGGGVLFFLIIKSFKGLKIRQGRI